MTKKEIKKYLKVILRGIDKDEVEDENGWWETSVGAEFGKQKFKEIEEFCLKINEDDDYIEMCNSAYRNNDDILSCRTDNSLKHIKC